MRSALVLAALKSFKRTYTIAKTPCLGYLSASRVPILTVQSIRIELPVVFGLLFKL